MHDLIIRTIDEFLIGLGFTGIKQGNFGGFWGIDIKFLKLLLIIHNGRLHGEDSRTTRHIFEIDLADPDALELLQGQLILAANKRKTELEEISDAWYNKPVPNR